MPSLIPRFAYIQRFMNFFFFHKLTFLFLTQWKTVQTVLRTKHYKCFFFCIVKDVKELAWMSQRVIRF